MQYRGYIWHSSPCLFCVTLWERAAAFLTHTLSPPKKAHKCPTRHHSISAARNSKLPPADVDVQDCLGGGHRGKIKENAGGKYGRGAAHPINNRLNPKDEFTLLINGIAKKPSAKTHGSIQNKAICVTESLRPRLRALIRRNEAKPKRLSKQSAS